MADFLATVLQELEGEAIDDALLAGVLHQIADRYACPVATLHDFDASSGLLTLRAQRGLPDALLPIVGKIPIGKGMAGLAAQRREPVQVCNLQTDASGDVRPGAKMTQMQGSIAVPMLDGDKLLGVLGVAKPQEYEFTADEIAELTTLATHLGRKIAVVDA